MTIDIEKAKAKLEEVVKSVEPELERVREVAQIKIARAEYDLLEAYFERIRGAYHSGRKEGKIDILNELERVSLFDRGIAKQIRLDAGLTVKKAAEIIGCHEAYLSRYENGQRKVGFPTKGKTVIKYLRFLKEHGYNPFEL